MYSTNDTTKQDFQIESLKEDYLYILNNKVGRKE